MSCEFAHLPDVFPSGVAELMMPEFSFEALGTGESQCTGLEK